MFEEQFEALSSLSTLEYSLFGVLIFPLSLSECGLLPGSVLIETVSGVVRDNYIRIGALVYYIIIRYNTEENWGNSEIIHVKLPIIT